MGSGSGVPFSQCKQCQDGRHCNGYGVDCDGKCCILSGSGIVKSAKEKES